jgi:hypothetical protein
MNIPTKTIKFKSTPENWIKEYNGLKSNTVRKFTESNDIRKEILIDWIEGITKIINIEIYNTTTREVFTRRITDVTKFEEIGALYFIISWNSGDR